MLIKIIKMRNDLDQGEKHELSQSRRDFLKKGIVTTSAAIAIPSAMHLLTGKALADEGCTLTGLQAADTPSFTSVELEGGNGFSRMIYPCDQAGAPLDIADGNMLGIGRADGRNTTLIPGLHLNQTDAFETALRNPTQDQTFGNTTVQGFSNRYGVAANVVAQALARVSGYVMYVRKNDDTDSNPDNPLGLVTTLQSNRSGAGQLRSKQIDASDVPPIFQPTNSVNDLVQSVGFLYTGSTQAKINLISNASRKISETRREALMRTLGGGVALSKWLCGLQNNVAFGNDNVGASIFNPDQYPGGDPVRTTFTNLANLNGNEKLRIALCDASARGYFLSALRQNGYDYHDGTNTTPQVMHARIAVDTVLPWAVTHLLRNQSGVLYLYTDGGINYGANRTAQGDRGSSGMAIVLVIKKDGGRFNTVGNMGFMNPADQTSSPTTIVGKGANGIRAGISAAVTYAQLCGVSMDAVNARTSSMLPRADLEALKGIVG